MKIALLISVVLLAPACSGSADDSAGGSSILLVTVDTLRADALGAYGNSRARTPRMDRLAAEGTRYLACWAPCPLTLPSHATVLTGLLPPEHGFRDNDPARPLPGAGSRSFRLVSEELRAAGYATGAFVSSAVLSPRTGLNAGFDTYDGPESSEPGALHYAERRGGDTVDRAAKWLGEVERPFFLWVHLFDPHDPYSPPVAFRSDADPGSPEAYADEVAYTDSCVGKLLDALESAGAAERTLVVLAADHGEGLGEHDEPTHGYRLHETTLRVPLILRWPGRIGAAEGVKAPVGLSDLRDLLLHAAGELPGTPSLLAPDPDRILVAETLYGWRRMGWAQVFAARRGYEKLVKGAARGIYQLDEDPGETARRSLESPGLDAAIDRYRALPSRIQASGPELPEMAGLPYGGGVGRSRLEVLPWTVNRDLRTPSPTLAAEIDRQKARVGRDDPDAVDADLRAILGVDPRNPTVWFWIGRNARAAKRPAEAAKAFRAAFDAGLKEARVLTLWLQALLGAGDLDAAPEVVKNALPEVVPDAPVWVMVGEVKRLTGDQTAALRCLARAEALARSESERELVSRFGHNLSSDR